jgi:hypothetical protein
MLRRSRLQAFSRYGASQPGSGAGLFFYRGEHGLSRLAESKHPNPLKSVRSRHFRLVTEEESVLQPSAVPP